MPERFSYKGERSGDPAPKPSRTGKIRLDPEIFDMMAMIGGGLLMTQARNRGDFEEAERIRQKVADLLEFRQRERADRSTPATGLQPGQPNLPNSLQVEPSLSPGQDVHPPEYYTGGRSRYPYLPPSLRTNPSGSDIHPPGYHGGGGGPYMPPMFRTGGK